MFPDTTQKWLVCSFSTVKCKFISDCEWWWIFLVLSHNDTPQSSRSSSVGSVQCTQSFLHVFCPDDITSRSPCRLINPLHISLPAHYFVLTPTSWKQIKSNEIPVAVNWVNLMSLMTIIVFFFVQLSSMNPVTLVLVINAGDQLENLEKETNRIRTMIWFQDKTRNQLLKSTSELQSRRLLLVFSLRSVPIFVFFIFTEVYLKLHRINRSDLEHVWYYAYDKSACLRWMPL